MIFDSKLRMTFAEAKSNLQTAVYHWPKSRASITCQLVLVSFIYDPGNLLAARFEGCLGTEGKAIV